jgi:hypothetical protein
MASVGRSWAPRKKTGCRSTTQRRSERRGQRFGKPSCHCATGESAHESTVLSYKQAGKTMFLMLPVAEVDAVRAATERYRSARTRLEEEDNAGLAELVARLRRPRQATS